MVEFPKVIFGKCNVCGEDGGDKPQADLDPIDAGYAVTSDGDNTDVRTVANDYLVEPVGSGVPLVYYDGKLMCEMCKKRLIADEESLMSADKHAETERFRAASGFKATIT